MQSTMTRAEEELVASWQKIDHKTFRRKVFWACEVALFVAAIMGVVVFA